MASDYPPGTDTSSQGNNFSAFIDCSSNGELEELFTALSQDGKVTIPPSDMGHWSSFAVLERWQVDYLPVYSVWAALVVVIFPRVSGYH